jgi:glyoxylase-like metal-dependent hydrolase (beta-lactamase superfamily II)
MQEIAPHIYIETAYAGVTLGAINWPHGLILIDAPFRNEDVRAWRQALINLNSGVDRMLINLDAQLDRTLGARAMDCTVVGHEKMAQMFRTRPLTFKPQSSETGAEWERYESQGSIRWSPPEISFTAELLIQWSGGDDPLRLEYHPGPAAGSIWAVLPGEGIIFVGDAVVPDQPPYLSGADMPAWMASLEVLTGKPYNNYTLISGRGGLVRHDQVRAQMRWLAKADQKLNELAAHNAKPEETDKLAHSLFKDFNPPAEKSALYQKRLKYGLYQYYARRYHIGGSDITIE